MEHSEKRNTLTRVRTFHLSELRRYSFANWATPIPKVVSPILSKDENLSVAIAL